MLTDSTIYINGDGYSGRTFITVPEDYTCTIGTSISGGCYASVGSSSSKQDSSTFTSEPCCLIKFKKKTINVNADVSVSSWHGRDCYLGASANYSFTLKPLQGVISKITNNGSNIDINGVTLAEGEEYTPDGEIALKFGGSADASGQAHTTTNNSNYSFVLVR